MKVGNKAINSKMVPTWLAVALTAFLVLSPIALVLAMTKDSQLRDYFIPAVLSALLLLVMTYAWRNIRRVEASLREEHNRLRVLIDNLPDRISIKDAQGRKVLANLADWQASGKTRMEDFIGKTDLEIFPPELAERYWADDLLVLQTGQTIVNREEPALDAQGKASVWTLATKVPLHDSDGKLIGLVGISRDISAFKQAAEAQRVAEERYREIFEQSVEGIYQTTADGRIVTVNPALAHMLGYASPDEIVADLRDIDRQFYVDRSRRAEFQRQIEAHGQIGGFESEVYRKDGSTMWISEHGRAVRDENGAVQYYEGTMVDMTERKQAEAAQRKAEEKYRNFFENSIAGIFQSTLDGRLVAVNPALARLLGYDSPEDLVASVTDIDQQLYARAGDRAELKRRLGQDGRVCGFETELSRKDGSTIWIVTNALLVRDSEGQPLCLEGTLVDISARKQAEQEQEETRRKQVAWISALEQRTREMSLLNQMSDLIQCCPTVDEAYSVIQQQARWIFPEESGALYIVNSSRNLAESKAAWGAAFADGPAFKPNDCWGFRRAQLHIAEETPVDGHHNTRPILHCQHLHSPAPEAYMCVPLIAQGDTLGVLHLRHSGGTPLKSAEAQTVWYSEARRELAHMVADSLALAISNISLRESLRQQSIRDPLTGMFNRRYMEESLEREISRAARAGRPLAVIMIDIDHFKHFNDMSGHAAGDAVLRELGALLRSEVREADIACRYGGEEFALIMPDASVEIALRRADKLREDVKRLDVRHGGRLLGPINISLGVAEFPRHGPTGDAVLKMADAALYRAKQAGRDRAVVGDI